MLTLANEPVYAGYTTLAQLITSAFPNRPRPNGQPYTRQQVHVWYNRRERNGFPEKHEITTTSGQVKHLFNVKEVLNWFENYTPSSGVKYREPGVDK